MAEYRALAQNTIKITTEMTLYHNTELGHPLVHNYPRIKNISTDGSKVTYFSLVPSNKFVSDDNCFFQKTHTTGKVNDNTSATRAIYEALKDYFTPANAVSVYVDGVRYFGQKSAFYCNAFRYKTQSTSKSDTVASNGTMPPAKLKTVIYSKAGDTIVITETDLDSLTTRTVDTGYTSSYGNAAGSIEGLAIKKEENDIVLAIEVEYPKYDIKISTGLDDLQYSLDDGLTFQQVTDNLELNQIEHVVFKNVGSTTRNIGTSEDPANVGTIPVGYTFVAVPEADGTWYIS